MMSLVMRWHQNVAAPTGAGKTLISVMLLKEKSRQLAAHLSFSEGRKVSVFLAPQVALVFQVGG
jgi:replicative superfamily II helicase